MPGMRLIILLAGLAYINYESDYEDYQQEPVHESWDLKRPDNEVETEVIIDPYQEEPVTPSQDNQESDW